VAGETRKTYDENAVVTNPRVRVGRGPDNPNIWTPFRFYITKSIRQPMWLKNISASREKRKTQRLAAGSASALLPRDETVALSNQEGTVGRPSENIEEPLLPKKSSFGTTESRPTGHD
jgi:hypothetical protein